MLDAHDVGAGFEDFLAAHADRLKRALVATYGSARGTEATAEALAYAEALGLEAGPTWEVLLPSP